MLWRTTSVKTHPCLPDNSPCPRSYPTSAGLVAYLGTTGALPTSLAFVGTEAAIAFMACGGLVALGALFLPIPRGKSREETEIEEIEEFSEPDTPITPPRPERESRKKEALKNAILERYASSVDPLPPEIYSTYFDDFAEKAQKALDICAQENLYLLYKSPHPQKPKRALPPTAAKRPLQWIVQEPELKDYAETLFKQLAIFACRFYSSEEVEAAMRSPLQYNDIKLSEDGYLESLDIDARSLLGLLDTFIPDWFAEYRVSVDNGAQFIPIARTPATLALIQQDLDRRREAIAFHQQHDITSATQLLVYDESTFSAETPEVQGVIKSLIKLINERPQNTPDLVSGRRVSHHLEGMFSERLYQENETSFPSYHAFKLQGIDPALRALQEKGYCYHAQRKPARADSTLLLCC